MEYQQIVDSDKVEFNKQMQVIRDIWHRHLQNHLGAFLCVVGLHPEPEPVTATPRIVVNPSFVHMVTPLTKSFVYRGLAQVFSEMADMELAQVEPVVGQPQ